MAFGGARRLAATALVLLASLIVLGTAAPIILAIGSDHLGVSIGRRTGAPRDSLVITMPTRIGGSGLLIIERGLLYSVDRWGRPLDLAPASAAATNSSNRVVVENATVRLQATPIEPLVDEPLPLIDGIGALQFESVTLRKATFHAAMPDGRTETISDINATVTHRRKASLLVVGEGNLRGQRIKFQVTSGIPADSKPGGSIPLKLEIRSALLDLVLDGRLAFPGATQINGNIEFATPVVRQVANWFGSPWPAGNELRDLKCSGQLVWSGPSMSINRAIIQVDGNQGAGTLQLQFNGERPTIGGTLAFKELDLGRYFRGRNDTGGAGAHSTWSNVMSADVSLPSVQFVDADLRMSSDKVKLGTFEVQRAAAAIVVSKGKLLADVGAFEFDGGRGNGQVSIDMSDTAPRMSVRGKLEEVNAGRVATNLFGHAVLSGRATITTDLSLTGRSGGELLASSLGRISVAVRNGGKIGVDWRALAAESQKRTVDGWSSGGRGQIVFDTFDATLGIRSGVLTTNDVKSVAGETTTVFSGQVDVPTNRLNLTISEPDTTPPAQTKAHRLLMLQIFGPWGNPTVRNDSGRARAADPAPPLSAGSPARL